MRFKICIISLCSVVSSNTYLESKTREFSKSLLRFFSRVRLWFRSFLSKYMPVVYISKATQKIRFSAFLFEQAELDFQSNQILMVLALKSKVKTKNFIPKPRVLCPRQIHHKVDINSKHFSKVMNITTTIGRCQICFIFVLGLDDLEFCSKTFGIF